MKRKIERTENIQNKAGASHSSACITTGQSEALFWSCTSTIFDRYLHLELNMTAGMRNQSIQRVWGHVRKKNKFGYFF